MTIDGRSEMAQQRTERGYGRGSWRKHWKKWLLIYAGAAVVLYGVIYLLLQAGGGSGGGGLYGS
jgi:hypothetical protein